MLLWSDWGTLGHCDGKNRSCLFELGMATSDLYYLFDFAFTAGKREWTWIPVPLFEFLFFSLLSRHGQTGHEFSGGPLGYDWSIV